MALDAGVHVVASSYQQAERSADLAIRTYEQGPEEERSFADLAIAHLDKATAQAAVGQVDAAAVSVRPVLDLREKELIAPLLPGLRRSGQLLRSPKLDGRTAHELRDQITGLSDSLSPAPGTIHA